jgi:hypothetical protein
MQHKALARAPAGVRKWAPTLIGLCAIPVIIKPIDHGVDALMDATIRPWLHKTAVDDDSSVKR